MLLRRARQASDPAELIKVVCHRVFFRGRRQWASAHLVSADPQVRGVGSWRKRGRDSRSSVKRCFQEEKGGTGLASRCGSCGTGASAGGCSIRCSPHVRQRFPRGWEGQGSTRVRLRAGMRFFGISGSDSGCHFRPSKHYCRSTLLLRRARQASDAAELIKVVCHGSSFGVGGSGRQPISYPPTPSRRVGSWRKRAPKE